MRVLWSLPKAAPALLRHLAGYVELAEWDLKRAQRETAASLVAFVVLALCAFFVLLMACVVVIALTWDGPHRVSAILWMGGAFLLGAIVALLYRSSLSRSRAPLLSSVRQEWRQDAVILEKILAGHPEDAT